MWNGISANTFVAKQRSPETKKARTLERTGLASKFNVVTHDFDSRNLGAGQVNPAGRAHTECVMSVTTAATPGIRWFTCNSIEFAPRAIRRPLRITVELSPAELHILVVQLESFALGHADCGCGACTLAADSLFARIAELREAAR